jgi:biotin operon repressor
MLTLSNLSRPKAIWVRLCGYAATRSKPSDSPTLQQMVQPMPGSIFSCNPQVLAGHGVAVDWYVSIWFPKRIHEHIQSRISTSFRTQVRSVRMEYADEPTRKRHVCYVTSVQRMNARRITRLLRLVHQLYSGSGQNVSGLAESCDVSRRTVFRDIETLRSAGLPVQFDANRDQYSLPTGYRLSPVRLSAEESLTLLVLAFEFGQSADLPFLSAARSAAAKLECRGLSSSTRKSSSQSIAISKNVEAAECEHQPTIRFRQRIASRP